MRGTGFLEHYNYFRDYDPSIGRYIQSDPIGLQGGANTFAYASSPLTQIDPLGLMAAGAGAASGGFGGIGAAGSGAGSAAGAIARGFSNLVSQCLPDDPCENLRRQMEGHMDSMERKFTDLFYDKHNLYNLAFDSNPGGSLANYGTWLGHISRYKGLRNGLANMVNEALRLGCKIPIRAYSLLTSSPPIKPLFK